MPEDRLRVAGWHAQDLEKRSDRVAQMMDLYDPDLLVVADAAEGPLEVPRLDRPPDPGGEHEASVWPGRAHVSPVGSLLLGVELERLANIIQERKATLPGASLDRRKKQLPADALQLLADVDSARIKVNVIPAQAESFTATKVATLASDGQPRPNTSPQRQICLRTCN